MPDQSLFPIVRSDDPRALVGWLERALDAGLLALHEGPDGTVEHAEVRLADGVLMLGQAGGDLGQPPGTAAVYVAVDAVDALYERAAGAGAEILRAPADTEYGSRDFTVRDPDGNLWSFGTYRPED